MSEARSAADELDRLAASEERFRWITGVISDPMLIIGEAAKLLHYNRAAARLFGHEILAADIGSDATNHLAERLIAADGVAVRLHLADGGTATTVRPHTLDMVWDGQPAMAMILETVEPIDDVDSVELASTATTALIIEVNDLDNPGHTMPIITELFELLEPSEGVTQAGGAAWCVVWRGRRADESHHRAESIVEQLSSRVGAAGRVHAGIARQEPGEDTPTLLLRCHRGLQQARADDIELAADPGRRRSHPDPDRFHRDVVGEKVTCELSPVVDVSNHHPAGAIARPCIDGVVLADARDLLRGADPGAGQTFDRLTAADALVRFNRWRRPSRPVSLHLPVHEHSAYAAEQYLRWLHRAATDVGLRPDEIVLGIHEADVVADPSTVRFLALARMAGFRTAIRALSGARLPVATLVDLWPDALLLAASVVRGDESRLLPALLAAGDEIGAVAIATGVTSTSQLDLLLDYECRYAVGPLLMRSIPATEVL